MNLTIRLFFLSINIGLSAAMLFLSRYKFLSDKKVEAELHTIRSALEKRIAKLNARTIVCLEKVNTHDTKWKILDTKLAKITGYLLFSGAIGYALTYKHADFTNSIYFQIFTSIAGALMVFGIIFHMVVSVRASLVKHKSNFFRFQANCIRVAIEVIGTFEGILKNMFANMDEIGRKEGIEKMLWSINVALLLLNSISRLF